MTLRLGWTYIWHKRGLVFSLLTVMRLIMFSLGQNGCAFVFFAKYLLLNLCILCQFVECTIFDQLWVDNGVLTLHFLSLLRIARGFKFGIAINRLVWLRSLGDIMLRICFGPREMLHCSFFLNFFHLYKNCVNGGINRHL